jgi:hypothetical protein
MISRTAFCSAQAAVIRPARTGPMPSTFAQASAQELPGIDRANAADHSRAEIPGQLARCGIRHAEGQSEIVHFLARISNFVVPKTSLEDPG